MQCTSSLHFSFLCGTAFTVCVRLPVRQHLFEICWPSSCIVSTTPIEMVFWRAYTYYWDNTNIHIFSLYISSVFRSIWTKPIRFWSSLFKYFLFFMYGLRYRDTREYFHTAFVFILFFILFCMYAQVFCTIAAFKHNIFMN